MSFEYHSQPLITLSRGALLPQMQEPVDGDGGLVVLTSSGMHCLSCPQTRVCRHMHAAGAVAHRPARVRAHTVRDQHQYLAQVHRALNHTGSGLALNGDSSVPIHVDTLKKTRCFAGMYSTDMTGGEGPSVSAETPIQVEPKDGYVLGMEPHHAAARAMAQRFR